MSDASATIPIPPEIAAVAARFPSDRGFKVKPGPTFLEYKKDLQGMVVGMICGGILFTGIGIGMMFVEWWFGLIFVGSGLIPLIMAGKVGKSKDTV